MELRTAEFRNVCTYLHKLRAGDAGRCKATYVHTCTNLELEMQEDGNPT